ncbi:MAG: DUF1566 domain-containing protein [Desulforegulaceae bacterium]|nr:DUF1566 domain-containing protein [Desulforegulaceae bacterium]
MYSFKKNNYLKIVVFLLCLFFISACGGGGSGKNDDTNKENTDKTNTKPVADAGNSATVPLNASVQLDGSKSYDSDGDILSYLWTLKSKPVGSKANLNSATLKKPLFETDISGSYIFELVVSDGYEDSQPDEVEFNATFPVSYSLIPDTGQTKCYDESGNEITCTSQGEDYFGQDANYQYWKNPSYTKLDSNGKELPDSAQNWVMVKDNVTGLIWEVKTDDGSVHDKDNTYTWYDAQNVFIAELNGSNFGGYSDWRMPTVKELRSIVDYGRYNPAIDINFFPDTMSSYYWSSTTYSNYTGSAWRVNFYYGYDGDYYKSSPYYVRAVRGGQ